MKKFWIVLFVALLGGSLVGERIRTLLLEEFAFFWRNARGAIFPRSVPAVGRPFAEESNYIPVIGKRLDGFASVLLAAAGENDGIKKGDRVIAPDDEYVGRIEHVSSKASQIVLASRLGEHFTGWLPVLSVPLELEGWGSGLLRALVPASFPIEAGDDVWYDTRLDAFVGDVISIQDIKNGEGEELKEIFVRHSINPLMLSSVSIRP